MPKVTRQLPEGYEAVSRPVARGIVESVIKFTGLRDKVVVQFNGDTDIAPMTGSKLSEQIKDTGRTRWDSTQKVAVGMREDFIEQEVLATPIGQKNQPVIFLDRALGISLKPVYHHIEGVLSFTYRAPDQVSAEQWIKGLLRHISEGRKEMYHEIAYEYAVPREFVAILRELHRLRENNAGYGESLGDWLKSRFVDRATVLTTMAGTEPLLVIKEAQKGVIGWFDWLIPAQPEKGDSGATYNATFEYHYQYQQVTGVHLEYPIMIHQQLLDEKWRGRNTPYELKRTPAYMSMAKDFYEQNRLYNGGFIETMEGVVYPIYDEWAPYNVPQETMKLFTCLLTVDPEDPTLVLNLNDLGHWDINPAILDYLIKNRRWITKHHFTPILISLYTGADRYDETKLIVSENGDVRTTEPMSQRVQYHFMMSALIDLTMLTRDRQDELRKYPDACLLILLSLDGRLEQMGLLPEVVGGRLVSKLGYLKALEFIRTTSIIYKKAKEIGRFTVGTYFLSMGRK